MAKKRRIRNFIGSMYNVRAWFGMSYITQAGNIITNSLKPIKDIHSAEKKYPSEKFNEAVARLNLSEEDILERQKGYFYNFLVFFIIGVCLAVYAIYRYYLGHWLSGWISTMMMIITFLFSMIAHFWYFQVKHRKLGCTLKEWYSNKINTN